MNRLEHRLFLLLMLVTSFSLFSQTKATLYRDTWGVPHIYADTEKAMAFAFGYAQAEDRLQQIFTNYRLAEGTLSEVYGKAFVDRDYAMKLFRNAEICRTRYAQLPKNVRELTEGFIAGIQAFMKEHPDKIPANKIELHPWHPIALGRAFIWWWPLDQALDDLAAGKREKAHTHGSNQWAVSGKRTATGAAMALVDPHLSWGEDGHWLEARLHGGAIHSCGICVAGTPLVALGHNRSLSWAATTGGPDCADVFSEEINPANPLQYRYDGQWRNIKVDTLIIRVKTDQGITALKKVAEYTHHGPIYERDGSVAYALALSYAEEISLITQMLAMNTATNLQQFQKALEQRQFMPQNIMMADQQGNIYYQRTGRVPIRNLKYDWSKPVPGTSSDSEWRGIHATADLVQILNPEIGFIQNCNISPGTMLPSSPMVSAKYPSYIYNDPQERDNPRGKRAVQLLAAETAMTFERAQQIATDTGLPDIQPWQKALQNANKKHKTAFSHLSDAVQVISDWNGHLDQNNRNAALYRNWRRVLSDRKFAMPADNVWSKEKELALLQALQIAKQEVLARFGDYQPEWGRTVVLKRGEKALALSGGSFENGISALRAVWGDEKEGVTFGSGGQSGPMVISLTRPIQSVSVLPWGQSDDPQSPHFFDQGEKLFSKGKFKPTWFEWQELKDHIESTKELKY